jgi:hypothetical protein
MVVLLGLSLVSCTQMGHTVPRKGETACVLLASSFPGAFLQSPYSLQGKARFDVNQYRLKGRFVLKVRPMNPGAMGPDNIGNAVGPFGELKVLDFVSSSYFGSHREDMTISLSGRDLVVFDRERGRYFKDEEAIELIRDATLIHGNVREIINLALGHAPDCGSLQRVSVKAARTGGLLFEGETRGRKFKFDFSAPGKKVREIVWPIEMDRGRMEDIRITYLWARNGQALESILLAFRNGKWQIKLGIDRMDLYNEHVNPSGEG